MKTLISTLALSLCALPASADIIKCVFTEPFASTTYSMAQQSLTIETPEGKPEVIKNVSFQIRGAAKFDIVAKNGNVLQELNLNNAGSDGMSDNIYPYSAVHVPMRDAGQIGIGGCSSNHLKVITP